MLSGRYVMIRGAIFSLLMFLLYAYNGKSLGKSFVLSITGGIVFGLLTMIFIKWREKRGDRG